MNRIIIVLLLTLMIAASGFAQYSEEWHVDQDYYEYGILYFDYNQDGYVDITKTLGNGLTVFDGTNSYEPIWTVVASDYEVLTVWDYYDFNNDGDKTVIFIAYNAYNETTFQIIAYDLLGSSPIWSSSEISGSYSNVTAENLDSDPEKELVVGFYQYNASEVDYDSRFLVLNGEDGSLEYMSEVHDGYMTGPYTGDFDGDDTVEILFNVYSYSDSTAQLYAYSFQSLAVEPTEPFIPDDIHLQQNFPNPFNPSTTIPLVIERSANVRIRVYDVNGREVAEVMNGQISAGHHEFRWNGRTGDGQMVASGMYFYELEVEGEYRMRKPMVLLR